MDKGICCGLLLYLFLFLQTIRARKQTKKVYSVGLQTWTGVDNSKSFLGVSTKSSSNGVIWILCSTNQEERTHPYDLCFHLQPLVQSTHYNCSFPSPKHSKNPPLRRADFSNPPIGQQHFHHVLLHHRLPTRGWLWHRNL